MIPPPGRPMLPSEQLQDAGGADHLDPGRVLGPAQGVDDGAGPLPPGIAAQMLRHPHQLFGRASADLRHHLRRVAGEVALEQLEDASRMRQRRIGGRLTLHDRRHLISRAGVTRRSGLDTVPVHAELLSEHRVHGRRTSPFVLGLLAGRTGVAPPARAGVVRPGSPVAVIAAEQTAQILGVLEPVLHDGGRVGVMQDVFVEPAVVGQDVELRLELLWGAVDMCVIHVQRAHPHKPEQLAAFLIPIVGPVTREPQRQISITARQCCKQFVVMRAIHRFEVVAIGVALHDSGQHLTEASV